METEITFLESDFYTSIDETDSTDSETHSVSDIDIEDDEPYMDDASCYHEVCEYSSEEPPSSNENINFDRSTKIDDDMHLNAIRSRHLGDISDLLSISVYHGHRPKPLVMHYTMEDNPLSQVFSRWTITEPRVSNYISEHFVFWSCRVPNRYFDKWIASIRINFGDIVAGTLLSLSPEKFPSAIILNSYGNELAVEAIIQSEDDESKLLDQLIQIRENFAKYLQILNGPEMMVHEVPGENWQLTESKLVPLDANSSEFQALKFLFLNVASEIIEICQVQNRSWFETYWDEKLAVNNRLGHHETEEQLYHGSAYEDVNEILRRGFDRERIGQHGVAYGRGYYFTSILQTADRFATPANDSRHKRILYCRVIIGASCPGKKSMAEPPVGYDSTTDSNGIYVVYQNKRIFPEFLVTYR